MEDTTNKVIKRFRPKASEETKKKMSISLSGKNNPNYGKSMSEEQKKKISLSKKGKPSTFLGKHHTEEAIERMRSGHLGKKLSEEHKQNIRSSNLKENCYLWKGDKVGYGGLHEYIRKYLPIPKSCYICKKEKRLYAACVTGVYNRDFRNWRYLCHKCHMWFDGNVYHLKHMKPTEPLREYF